MPAPAPTSQNPVRWLVAAVGWTAYLLALALALPVLGDVAWATVFLPVVATGYGWGRRAGVLSAVAATLAGNLLYRVLYDAAPGPWTGAVFPVALQVIVGYGAGWAGETRRTLGRVTTDLREQTSRLEDAQATAHIGSWSYELDRDIDWSREMQRLFGFDRTPADVGEILARVPADDHAAFRGFTERLLAGHETETEHRVLLPDGSVRWLHVRGRPQRGPDGTVVRIGGTAQDITTRRDVAEQLERSLAQLEEAQSVAHIGSWRWEPGAAVSSSAETHRIFGVDEDALRDMDQFLALVHPDDRESVQRTSEETHGVEGEFDISFRVVRPDGQVRWVRGRGRAERPQEAEAAFLTGTVQDVTEEEASRRALAASESLLRGILESQEGGFFALEPARDDRPARILVASRAVEEIFGDGDLLGDGAKTFLKRIHARDRPRVREEARQAFAGTGRTTVEFRITRPGEGECWLRVSLTPVLREGVLERVDGHVLDVTAEKERDQERHAAAKHRAEARRLREMDRMKATFLNTAAHELATPLTPLRLQMAMLSEEQPGHAGLAMMGRNVERLQVLVHDLLDASRLQAGRLQTNLVPTDLDMVLHDAVRAGEMQARQHGLTWATDVEPRLMVLGDEARLMQVINNLLNNAFKFTPQGGSVSLTARRRGAHAVVQVQDTGMGMTRAQVQELFKPFNQFHRDAVGVHAGTGLGLYISKGIIDRHGGTLRGTSGGPGRGSTFTVRIPLAPA